MLIDNEINIRINNLNRDIYPNNNYGEYININIKDLPIGSGILVNVKCDFCDFIKKIQYRKYVKNTKNFTVEYSCSNKCSISKYRKTCLDRYGVDNTTKLPENLEKMKKTCLDRYGVDNPLKDEFIKNKVVTSRIKNGKSSGKVSEYSKFRNKCRNITFSKKKELLSLWDGYDYYDGEYIGNNWGKSPLDANYPTIEHKISILEGFLNKIDINIICDINNLCFCKRSINSSLNSLTFGEKLKKNE